MRTFLSPAAEEARQGADDLIYTWIEQVIEWLMEDPVNPHATQHVMTNGMWWARAQFTDEDWVLFWRLDEDDDGPFAYVTYIGPLSD